MHEHPGARLCCAVGLQNLIRHNHELGSGMRFEEEWRKATSYYHYH